MSSDPNVPKKKKTALIVYASETGKAQDVAEELSRLVQRLHFKSIVLELNRVTLSDLLKHTITLVAISTTGQGDLPANATEFWKKLRSSRLPPNCLHSLHFTSFGLGDSSYPQFNWAHRKLHNRLVQLGSHVFHECGEADEQMPEGIDGTFLAWTASLRKSLLELYPLPEGITPVPDDQFLIPEWALQLLDDYPLDTAEKKHLHQLKGSFPFSKLTEPKSKQFTATLLDNSRVTPKSHWQNVRLLEFSTPQVPYEPGDVLTIFPKNSVEAVEEFINLMGWGDIADKAVKFVQTPNNEEEGCPPWTSGAPADLFYNTLRDYITDSLDINSIPRRSFFASLAHFTEDEAQRERLVEFTDPQYLDELFDYTTRPRRSILEVLQEFHTVKIPLKWISSVIPAIRGRQFSIASGGGLKTDSDGNGRIQLLVAIVKYRTVIKKIREGLCTKYLADLQPGSKLNVLLNKGGMKVCLDRPAVMVGPGTGVAPLRSMIYERVGNLPQPENRISDDRDAILFFGGRNRQADYFFENEWQDLTKEHPLKVVPAFSRDQASKIYVQDLVRTNSSQVYKLLATGIVYVCGSSGKMPQAVREALIEVFQIEGKMQRSDAESMLLRMEREGRYQQETW